MSEIPDVLPGETVATSWGNNVKDRTLMRYASAAARDASVIVPIAGDAAWLTDINRLTVYDGGNWLTHVVDRGTFLAALGTVGLPSHSFDTDPTSGVMLFSAFTGMGIVAGGVEKIRVNTNRVGLIDPPDTNSAANVYAVEEPGGSGVWNLYVNKP